jgi:spore coat polysaccharide biosynthesis protein SpsF
MIGAIIQARMGSTRLPKKVLSYVAGKPLLAIQLERVEQAKSVDKIIVATSVARLDDEIEAFCNETGYLCFRGSEHDVLSRYYLAAQKYGFTTIVRLTADCPLIDPKIIDAVVSKYQNEGCDYIGNTVPPESSTFPDGSDVEVFSFTALTKAYRECVDPAEREHVTFYFWKSDNGFKTIQFRHEEDWSNYRFTVDYPEDLEVVNFLISTLNKKNQFGYIDEIITMLDSNPIIKKKNDKYHFGVGWVK